jgi:hypothetical protein
MPRVPLGQKTLLTAEVRSSSGADTYIVTRRGDEWECTCLGFVYHASRDEMCRHINLVRKALADGLISLSGGILAG